MKKALKEETKCWKMQAQHEGSRRMGTKRNCCEEKLKERSASSEGAFKEMKGADMSERKCREMPGNCMTCNGNEVQIPGTSRK